MTCTLFERFAHPLVRAVQLPAWTFCRHIKASLTLPAWSENIAYLHARLHKGTRIASSSSHVGPPARFANAYYLMTYNNYTSRRFRTCIYDNNNLRTALVKQKNKTDAHTTINNIVSIISILNLALCTSSYDEFVCVCVFIYRGQTSVNSHRSRRVRLRNPFVRPHRVHNNIIYNMYTFSIIRILYYIMSPRALLPPPWPRRSF